jgi:putative ABC transport system permease protein
VAVIAVGAAVIIPAVGNRNEFTPFVFMVGSILVVLGTGLTSPFLLEQLARVAGRLPTGPRLALRDAARFRARNGPIVTAAMAGLAASITVAAGLGTAHANAVARHVPALPPTMAFVDGPRQLVDAASTTAAAAMGAEVHSLRLLDAVVRGTGTQRDQVLTVYVVSPELAAELGGLMAAEALRKGRLVSLDGALRGSWKLSALDPATGGPRAGPPLKMLEVAVPPPPHAAAQYPSLPTTVVGADVATLVNMAGASDSWERRLLIGPQPFTPEQVAEAGRTVAAVGDELSLDVDRGPNSIYHRLQWAATLIGALAGLLIVVVAIALAATEARNDLRILAAVGAGPRTRRSVATGRALLLSGLGAVLAVPVGMVPALAVLSIAAFVVPVVIPWAAIALVAIGVPAVTTIGAGIAARMTREPLARI